MGAVNIQILSLFCNIVYSDQGNLWIILAISGKFEGNMGICEIASQSLSTSSSAGIPEQRVTVLQSAAADVLFLRSGRQ